MRPLDKILKYFEEDKRLANMMIPEYLQYLCAQKDKDECSSRLKAYFEMDIDEVLGKAVVHKKIYVYPFRKGYKAEFLIKPKNDVIILEYHLTMLPEEGSTMRRVIRKDD